MSRDAATVRTQIVKPGEDGQRLDNWLLRELKTCPKSLIYRIIRKGEVRVNGKRAKPMQKLNAGDTVRIPPVRVSPQQGADVPPERVAGLVERIILDDRHYVVIDKPAGLAVHGGSGLGFGAIDVLRAHPAYHDVQLAHRLDRETSGCLVFARTRPALLAFQDALKRGQVTKRYLCQLQGWLNDRTVVDAPLRKVSVGGERVVEVHPDGKMARSEFKPLEPGHDRTLCEVDIETGRTHQIRVHAAHLGHPVIGDVRYGSGEPGGLRLHCTMMGFDWDEKGYALSVSAPLPPTW